MVNLIGVSGVVAVVFVVLSVLYLGLDAVVSHRRQARARRAVCARLRRLTLLDRVR